MNKKIIVSLLVLFNIFAGNLIAEENISEGKNYKYIAPINVATSNKLLTGLIENNWDYKYLKKIVGEPDSFFMGYNVYFAKGINVRKTEDRLRTIKSSDNEYIFNLYSGLNAPEDKLYNIVFNNKYSEDILKDININSAKSYIIKKLGKPQFENLENQVIGYKTKYFYIFFIGDEKLREISVYKRDNNYDKAAIKKILIKAEKDKSYKGHQIVRDILTVWNDCDFHFWRRGVTGSYIGYLSQGVVVDGGETIIIKNNFEGELTDSISFPNKIGNLKNFNNKLISFELDKDLVFEFELQRLQKQKKFEERAEKGEGILAPDGKRRAMVNDHEGGWDAGLIIYYVNRDGPDREIIFGFYGPKEWLSDRYLILEYAVTFTLFIYDILENKMVELNNNDSSAWQTLISAKEGKIVYQVDENYNSKHKKTYTKFYTFDKDGKIIIK